MMRILLLLLAFLAGLPSLSRAAITCTSTDFNTNTGAASNTLTITETIPTATYRRTFLAVQNRSDITTTISSVSDTGSGTWTVRQGPTDNVNYRIWFYDRDGGSDGSITVTVTFSGSINSSGVMGTCTSTASLDYVSSATVATYTTAGGATVTSNTRTVTNTGIIVSDQHSSGNSTVSSMGTNSTAMNTASLPTHIGIRSESSGTYDVTFTLGFAVNGMLGAHLYQEAAAAATTRNLMMMGVGN